MSEKVEKQQIKEDENMIEEEKQGADLKVGSTNSQKASSGGDAEQQIKQADSKEKGPENEEESEDDNGEFMYVDEDFIEEMDGDDQGEGDSDFKTMKESEIGEGEEFEEGDILDLNKEL